MSEQVSDAQLIEWADGRIFPVNMMADELRRFRKAGDNPRFVEQVVDRLSAWESLGESAEGVRAELELLRARVAPQERAQIGREIARPSFAEAFEDACLGYALRSSKSIGDREAAVTLWELVKEARLASRDGGK